MGLHADVYQLGQIEHEGGQHFLSKRVGRLEPGDESVTAVGLNRHFFSQVKSLATDPVEIRGMRVSPSNPITFLAELRLIQATCTDRDNLRVTGLHADEDCLFAHSEEILGPVVPAQRQRVLS